MARNCYRVIGVYFISPTFIQQINNIKIYFETHDIQKQSSICGIDGCNVCYVLSFMNYIPFFLNYLYKLRFWHLLLISDLLFYFFRAFPVHKIPIFILF